MKANILFGIIFLFSSICTVFGQEISDTTELVYAKTITISTDSSSKRSYVVPKGEVWAMMIESTVNYFKSDMSLAQSSYKMKLSMYLMDYECTNNGVFINKGDEEEINCFSKYEYLKVYIIGPESKFSFGNTIKNVDFKVLVYEPKYKRIVTAQRSKKLHSHK